MPQGVFFPSFEGVGAGLVRFCFIHMSIAVKCLINRCTGVGAYFTRAR